MHIAIIGVSSFFVCGNSPTFSYPNSSRVLLSTHIHTYDMIVSTHSQFNVTCLCAPLSVCVVPVFQIAVFKCLVGCSLVSRSCFSHQGAHTNSSWLSHVDFTRGLFRAVPCLVGTDGIRLVGIPYLHVDSLSCAVY